MLIITAPLPEHPQQQYHYRRIHNNSITAGLIQSQHHQEIDSHSTITGGPIHYRRIHSHNITTGPTTTEKYNHSIITGGPIATVPLPEYPQPQYCSRIDTVTAPTGDRQPRYHSRTNHHKARQPQHHCRRTDGNSTITGVSTATVLQQN